MATDAGCDFMTASQQLEVAHLMLKQAMAGRALQRFGQMVNPAATKLGVLGRPPIGKLNPAVRTPGGADMQDTLLTAANQRGAAASVARQRAGDAKEFGQWGTPRSMPSPSRQVANGPRSLMTGRPGPARDRIQTTGNGYGF